MANRPQCAFENLVDIENPTETNKDLILRNVIRRTLLLLEKNNKQTFILIDNPNLPYTPTYCAKRRFNILLNRNMCVFKRELYDNYPPHKWFNNILKDVAKDFSSVNLIDLSSRFCDSELY